MRSGSSLLYFASPVDAAIYQLKMVEKKHKTMECGNMDYDGDSGVPVPNVPSCSTPRPSLCLAADIILLAEELRLEIAYHSNTPCSTLHKAIGVWKSMYNVGPQLATAMNGLNHAFTAVHHLDKPKLNTLRANVLESMSSESCQPTARADEKFSEDMQDATFLDSSIEVEVSCDDSCEGDVSNNSLLEAMDMKHGNAMRSGKGSGSCKVRPYVDPVVIESGPPPFGSCGELAAPSQVNDGASSPLCVARSLDTEGDPVIKSSNISEGQHDVGSGLPEVMSSAEAQTKHGNACTDALMCPQSIAMPNMPAEEDDLFPFGGSAERPRSYSVPCRLRPKLLMHDEMNSHIVHRLLMRGMQ
jgi:hypothetical protein